MTWFLLSVASVTFILWEILALIPAGVMTFLVVLRELEKLMMTLLGNTVSI